MSNFTFFPQCCQKTCTADMYKQGLVLERIHTYMYLLLSHCSMPILKISCSSKEIFALPVQCFYISIHYALKPFPNKPWFLRVCRRSHLKTPWEKEKLLVVSNFSSSHSFFHPFGELAAIFIRFQIDICKTFHFARVYKICHLGKGLILGTFIICTNYFSTGTCGRRVLVY